MGRTEGCGAEEGAIMLAARNVADKFSWPQLLWCIYECLGPHYSTEMPAQHREG